MPMSVWLFADIVTDDVRLIRIMSLKRFKQHLKPVQYIAGCYVHALEPRGKKKTKFIGDGVLALGSICSRFFYINQKVNKF
jgi:hypothetical protein